jgi:hypothetical protein
VFDRGQCFWTWQRASAHERRPFGVLIGSESSAGQLPSLVSWLLLAKHNTRGVSRDPRPRLCARQFLTGCVKVWRSLAAVPTQGAQALSPLRFRQTAKAAAYWRGHGWSEARARQQATFGLLVLARRSQFASARYRSCGTWDGPGRSLGIGH